MPKHIAHSGKFLGNYRITDELLSNPTRRIFLGETLSSPRQYVAIKWLHTVHLDAQQEESFLQEAQFLQQFQHPHILPLIAAGCHKSVPHMVTAYAPDGSLDKTMQYQARLPWNLEQALQIIFQIGQALQYAHQQNVIHCNLKPQNILFNAQGQALLADFRLVSLPDSLYTSANSSYMAPEQFLGTISKKCDQYALGCIAYEMLTGHTPYQGQSLLYHGSQRLPRLIPPTHFNPSLPAHVEQAILTALALEPAQRHPTIQAFLNALGATPALASAQISNETLAAPAMAAFNAQVPIEADLFEKMDFYPATPTSSATINTKQRNTVYRSKRGILKYRKILIALACTLVLASTGSGLYVFAFIAAKPQKPMTPLVVRTGPVAATSTITSTSTISMTPTIAASPTSTPITHPVTLQPQPTTTGRPTRHPSPVPTQQAAPTSPVATGGSSAAFTITPTQLNNANCLPRTGSSYLCTIHLSLSAVATTRQTWFAYSIGVVARIVPFIGTIAPGQSQKVSIIVFDHCTQPGAFVFSIGRGRTITIVNWAC